MHLLPTARKLSVSFMLILGLGISTFSFASDHDDGQADLKGSALNLTDLYVFREDNQTGKLEDKKNLILVMNSAPRSLPRQQYYFSPQAHYEFHLTRVKKEDKNYSPTGKNDIIIRFHFGASDKGTQSFVITAIRNGKVISTSRTTSGKKILTTSLAAMDAGNLIHNKVKLGGYEITVFAGLREDPFFFDVQQFFRVRAGAAGLGPKVGFSSPETAEDFTKDYNVNTIVARVPIEFLQTKANEPVFDVWQTISVK